MALNKSAKASAAILSLLILLVVWYAIAANYGYSALAGTYVLSRSGETCVLRLRPDQTFTEELTRAGNSKTVEGTWHRYGEAHVSFSNSFVPVTGEELNASGEAHGQFDRTLGLFPTLTLAPLPGGPEFRKKLLR